MRQSPSSLTPVRADLVSDAEWSSALFDNELPEDHVDVRQLSRDPAVLARFARYACISDALHPGGVQRVSPDFQSRVMQAIAQEPAHFLPAQRRETRQKRRLISAFAASIGAVGFVSAAYFVALPGLESADSSVIAQSTSAPLGQQPALGGGLKPVRVQSPWEDPNARRLIDAHGPTVVKMRLESEQP